MHTETTPSPAGVVVGERAISFTLPDQEGKPFRLADAIARGPVVVFFYPKDGTPGCTAEACSFRDASEDFAAAGATVVGISSDDAAAHAKFAADHRLGYPILVDEGGRVRAQWKVPRALFGMMDGRVTYTGMWASWAPRSTWRKRSRWCVRWPVAALPRSGQLLRSGKARIESTPPATCRTSMVAVSASRQAPMLVL